MINTILNTILILMIVEGGFALVFPTFTKKIAIKMFKNRKNVMIVGFIEIIIALTLILII